MAGILAMQEQLPVLEYRLSFIVYRLSFTVHRLSFIVYRLSFCQDDAWLTLITYQVFFEIHFTLHE